MAPALEALVTDAVLDNLERLEGKQVPVDVDVDQLHARLAAARLKRLPFEDPDYVGLLGVAAASRALTKADDEITRLEDELAHAIGAQADSDEPRLPAVKVRELWPTLTIDEQREVILGAVEAVTVSRGVRRVVPLADRVQIYWKGDALPFVIPTPGRPRRDRDEVEAGMTSA
jgi:hypothetical protein